MSAGTAGRRVVVTGLGAVTPLGSGVSTFWQRLVAGASGVRAITLFDADGLSSRIAGEVPDFDPSGVLDRKEMREQTGILMSTGLGGTATIIEQVGISTTSGPTRLSPFFIPMAIANMPSGVAGIVFGALGPNFSTTSACASSGHALGEANEIIRRGDADVADVMLAGGCEAAVCDATVGGFAAMRALSTRNDEPEAASRPFDAARDGFVIAEGAAALVLEELEHALRRGVRIYAEVCGYGATADGHHITTPSPGGAGAVRAARRALQKAGLEPARIDLVSAHATSTAEGDPTELVAINTLVGDHARDVSVTATKSSIGHTLGAAGAIAAVATVKALQDGVVPPTLNLVDPDEHAGALDLTPLRARRRDLDVALVNSFGFGGQNAAVILQRWSAA